MNPHTDSMRNTVQQLFDHKEEYIVIHTSIGHCFVETSSTHPTGKPSADAVFINYAANLIYLYQDTPETKELQAYALLFNFKCHKVDNP